MKKTTGRIIIIVSLIAVVTLFAFFLKDILIPYVKMEIANDLDGAKELLISKGIWGFFTVVLVEALQMVVIFIPAEFIQISSGMSYPFLIAVLLCDLGVCLGATIIYLLVKLLNFSNEVFDKREERINAIATRSKRSRSSVLLMYFLFIMPIIPFGAICYYGSKANIKYPRYILTVATGVIPSIVTSNIMGAATKYFLANHLPLPLLVLIIVLLGALLFLALILFLDKVYFKENDKTPDSVIYSAFFRFLDLCRKRRQKLVIDRSRLNELDPPFIILSNHPSFYDFYYVKKLFDGFNPALVANKHIISNPLIKRLAKKAGFIPKRLFNKDFVTPKGILHAVRGGYPVLIFPEGRLSLTGRENPVIEKGADLYKKLGVDIAVVRIEGAYFSKPKWRRKFFRSEIRVGIKEIFKKEDIAAISDDELNGMIDEALKYDESNAPVNTYRRKDMAKGLENVLYRCIDCGTLYSTASDGNELICTACGKRHRLSENYLFDGDPYTIDGYYRRIKELEFKELDEFDLQVEVDAAIFRDKGKYRTREKGTCFLSPEGFGYHSNTHDFLIEYSLLPALPFSCDEEFEVYYGDEFFYFYPLENRRQTARWALIVDLLEERRIEKEKQTDRRIGKDFY